MFMKGGGGGNEGTEAGVGGDVDKGTQRKESVVGGGVDEEMFGWRCGGDCKKKYNKLTNVRLCGLNGTS